MRVRFRLPDKAKQWGIMVRDVTGAEWWLEDHMNDGRAISFGNEQQATEAARFAARLNAVNGATYTVKEIVE